MLETINSVTKQNFIFILRKCKIRYEIPELIVDITYQIYNEHVKVDMEIIKEKNTKIISIHDEKKLITLVNSKKDMIITPRGHGEMFFLSENSTDNFICNQKVCSWNGFTFNFIAMIHKKIGLIFRPHRFSTLFHYGEIGIEGKRVLCFGGSHYFRPIFCCNFNTPLCHKSLGFDLRFVEDENSDGRVNWVDVGIKYRNTYIKKNKNPDATVKNGVTCAIPMFVEKYNSYADVLEDIKKIDFAPSVWWLIGAHVSKGYDHDWSSGPEPSWGDYFRFKEEARKYGAKIGVHMNLDDVYKTDNDWNPEAVRKNPDQKLMKGAIWENRQSYLRDIHQGEKSGGLYKFIDQQFKNWQVRAGDTWHWDVLTAVGGRECYDLNHPATMDNDFEARYKILKYTKQKRRIHITSEGTLEKFTQYCDFTKWSNSVNLIPEFPNVKFIPLTPVILLGRTYYGSPFGYGSQLCALNLLLGCKMGYGGDGTIDGSKIADGYFKQNLIWTQIADLEVVNVTNRNNKWTVEYSDGSVLKVDLETGEYSYFKEGILYKGYSPLNVWGYVGLWREGKFNILLPKGNYEIIKGKCKIEKTIKKGRYVQVIGTNHGFSLLRRTEKNK